MASQRARERNENCSQVSTPSATTCIFNSRASAITMRAIVASFEAMFRAKLARLYELLHLPVPEQLSIPFHHGDGSAEHGGTMKRVT